jgi:RHS repeat-associated protein
VGKVLQSCQSLPYGNGESCTPTPTEQLFTQKERDTESGNDFFGARYYSSVVGRWMSPDPSGLAYANKSDPQSLNHYVYVRNNPLIFIDPNGMYCDYSDHNDPDSGFLKSQFDFSSNRGECKYNGGVWVNDAYTHHGRDDSDRPEEAVPVVTTPPTPGVDPEFDRTVLMDADWLQKRQPEDAPTSAQYIKAVQKYIAPLPNVCQGGVNLSLGSAKGSISLGQTQGANAVPNGGFEAGDAAAKSQNKGVTNFQSATHGYLSIVPANAYFNENGLTSLEASGKLTIPKTNISVGVTAWVNPGSFGDPNCR